jgi:hypothetical protein
MKQIKLTQNKYAIVDDEDFDLVNKYKWRFAGDGYALTNIYLGRVNGKSKCLTFTMHSLFLDVPTKGYVIDHINRNKLDNRRKNLRVASRSLNAFNTGVWKHNKSGITGVSWDKVNNKWRAAINKNKKAINLGRFADLEKAILARKKAEEIYVY